MAKGKKKFKKLHGSPQGSSKSTDAAAGPRKWPLFWLILILLFAVILRIGVHLQASANDPAYGHPRQDEKTYHGWAESFSKGEMPKDIPFAAPPFYSFTLGNNGFFFLFSRFF